jgi:hypothetical protein
MNSLGGWWVILGEKGLWKADFCFGVPFQFIGGNLAVLLFDIINFSLGGISPEISIPVKSVIG